VGALAGLRAEGKIRYIGLSNVTAEQLKEALAIVPIVSVQNRFNLEEHSDEALVRECEKAGVAFIPWGPLAAKPFAPQAPLAQDARLEVIARAHEATPGQIALAWLLHFAPNILLIPGTTSTAHLDENIAASKLHLDGPTLESLSRSFG
jgi:aryl-alcohol dehydrogenase-like predicted oxidoreductase